jgi:hypothetical protein
LVRTDRSYWSLSLLFTKFILSIYCLMTIIHTHTHTHTHTISRYYFRCKHIQFSHILHYTYFVCVFTLVTLSMQASINSLTFFGVCYQLFLLPRRGPRYALLENDTVLWSGLVVEYRYFGRI